jgi:hypothetical protein
MSAFAYRFDRKDMLSAIVRELLGSGVEADAVDVTLCRFGAVDLDLLAECLREIVPNFTVGNGAAACAM